MTHFLVAGSPSGRPPRGLAPAPGDRVIAADLGARHALAWGWPLHLLVGDLDSLPAGDAAAIRASGTPVITVPAAKDETDLELALAHALAEGARRIVICAALGGRTDHLLANVLLLARPDLAGLDVSIADGPETVRLLRGPAAPKRRPTRLVLHGAAGDLLTLLPLGGDAIGVTTHGLRYPLCDESLFLGQARGASNVFVAEEAEITLRRGMLLVTHIADG